MDLKSPIATPSTSRDPFELERLADELEAREHSLDPPVHDLPLYPSLAHDNPFFTATVFDVEEFLLSRVHTSLPDLRAELRDYLSVLKEELVQLINDDYEAFISLSTDLRGEGARLDRLKWPLGDLKSQILVSSSPLNSRIILRPVRNPDGNCLLFRMRFKASLKSGLPFVMRRLAPRVLPIHHL
jgi:conserved oligomeric Golgi complex subunit 2